MEDKKQYLVKVTEDSKGRLRMTLSDEAFWLLFRKSGVKSKKRRIRKKAVQRVLNKALLRTIREKNENNSDEQ